MQTANWGKRRTHWLAGTVAVLLTVFSFGAQVILAEHYAQAGGNAGGSSLASREAATTVSPGTENPALFKTASRQDDLKSGAEKQPTS